LSEILRSENLVIPVLLIDGWDELGHFGTEFQEKLFGFLKEYPNTRTIITTRPHAEGQPSSVDGFLMYIVQPLTNK
jgi:hypothetical protein